MENVFVLESNCANGVRLRHSRFTRNFMNIGKMVFFSNWEEASGINTQLAQTTNQDSQNLWMIRNMPDLMAYIKEIDTQYTNINNNTYRESLISIVTSINGTKEDKLNKIKYLIESVIRKFNYKRKRLVKNVACLLPRLQRKFAKDPKKLMSTGYYGLKWVLRNNRPKHK